MTRYDRFVKNDDVYDGDSFQVHPSINGISKIRIADFDAPELNSPGGIAAKRRLQNAIGDKHITIYSKATDSYRRIIADVYVNGSNVLDLI